MRLAFHDLRQPGHWQCGWQWCSDRQVCSSSSPEHCSFDLVWSTLTNCYTPWMVYSLATTIKPGAQLLLATLLEDLLLVLFQTRPCDKLLPQFLIPAGSSYISQSMIPLQHLFRSSLSISALPRSTASILRGQCHKIIHWEWEVSYSLIPLFILGLETQADCVFNSEPNCCLKNAI